MQFSHLHNHTQFSLLDGASNIDRLMKKAVDDNMPAVAITDHGNMFGVFDFVAKANQHKVKPIIGCEFYVVEDHTIKQFTKEKKDRRYHQLLLAKNEQGYKNISKLCSIGYIDGLYSKYPRVTKALIEEYKENLIATTCCIGAIIPQAILRQDEATARKEFEWWYDRFGEDFYVELQRHDIPDQNTVNEVLLRFAKEYGVKIIASNDSHYVDRDDALSHDILLCVNTNEKLSTPKQKDFDDDDSASKRNTRFAFPNEEFYFKNTAEMTQKFSDLPQAIDNTNEIVGKIENIDLKKDILLPNFPIPDKFEIHADNKENQWEYLKHLTYEGARKRYGELTEEVRERVDFELFTIKTMGFAGYFLIVMDFIQEGRNMGVLVGPGRGSAAGSVVAYCIAITNIDPIKYNLLFERFLNPERLSMPDIDTDFDDEGRQKVIDYVVEKYGKHQVAQIITYGTMATKSAIKDVARVMEFPLSESNYIAKLVPDRPAYRINFQKLIHLPETGPKSLVSMGMQPDEIANVKIIRAFYHGNDLAAAVLKQAEKLEGTVRNTGIHAAGIIIAPEPLYNILPVSTSKDSDFLVTQYEGKIVEDAGVIKMDFLGLKNLSIIKEALRMIKENHDVSIDIDNIHLDDKKTYALFQRGETNAVFQFESDGMKKHMREMRPDRFDDLIALNALYRPGPMAYIPTYNKRKHGQEEVVYDLPEVEEYLGETYGITVYQEQVMLLSQKLAGFTKGDADVLRKAMGKKQLAVLSKMKEKFIAGIRERKYDEKKCEKIWTDWEAFAEYAFNKSHSTCYAFVAYQTAYLKAHYPSEYMAAVLTSNLGNIEKITFFLEECQALNIPVLGPDINESQKHFAVNDKGEIRFGLGGIKGTGDAAVESIIDIRNADGGFKDIFEFVSRINLRTVNKKTLESLAYAGAFDTFVEIHRATYFSQAEGRNSFIELLIRYANNYHENKAAGQSSLFGSLNGDGFSITKPIVPQAEKWTNIEKLKYEKEVVGFYISGHPLDQFSIEMKLCKPLSDVLNPENLDNEFSIGGMVSSVNIRQSKNGNPFAIVKIEDYNGSLEMMLFGNDYINFANYLNVGNFLFLWGKVQNRWKNENEFEFKPIDIDLLQNIKSKRFKEIRLMMDMSTIDEEKISDLIAIASQNPGDFDLKLQIFDTDEQADVELRSRSIRVDLSPKVVSQFKNIVGQEHVKWA
jgi:DNA polymerase-3 subunit alpha